MAATRKFAEGTTVSPEKTRAEIEQVLRRYGASSFVSGYDGQQAAVMFEAHGRRVRFTLTFPGADDPQFRRTKGDRVRSPEQRAEAAVAEERRRWRTLLLAIKAKLDVVESEIESFEEAFATHIVLPDGSSVGEWLLPQIDQAYESMTMPPMLALGPG